MKRKVFRTVGVFLVAGLLVAGGLLLYIFRTGQPDMMKAKADFHLTATELYQAFEADEAAAMSMYAGKIIEVTGRLEDVETNEWGHVTISFVDPFFGVTCTVDSLVAARQAERIALLARGDSLTVKGRCDGMLSDVRLVRCVVLE